MSLESVHTNHLTLVGGENNETGMEDTERMLSDTQPMDEDREDGELEDGEIDDDEGETPPPPTLAPIPSLDQRVPESTQPKTNHHNENSFPDASHNHHKHDRTNQHRSGSGSEQGEGSGKEKDDKAKHRKRNKSRKRRPRDREREREKDDRKKKRKKNRRYVDHDQVEDEGVNNEWQAEKKHRSPRGPYESPSRDNGAPSGSYDDPYASPPGLYDSPSDEEGYGPPPKLKRMDRQDSLNSSGSSYPQDGGRGGSMMSMLGDDYMDANVAANEKEDMFLKGGKNQFTQERKRLRKDKAKHYQNIVRQREQQQPRKRTLAETPMDERPFCKFYMDGKCNKGHECPFNHDFNPPTKLEVCKFYLNDACTKGCHCLYMHGEFPCKFFHNNGTCANGDNCKFSHEELDDDGHKIMDRLNYGDNSGFDPFADDANNMVDQPPMLQSPRKKVSLLGDYPSNYGPEGSPPHHMMEDHKEKLKKIPSIFDIQVFPPGQGPPPNRMLSPSGPPVSSSGPPGPGMNHRPRFYNDMNNSGPGPGPRGPGGPGLMGPPPGPGPMMMGPGPGPMRMGPPGFFPGNFNIRPGLDPALAMELVKKLQEKEREQQEQAAKPPHEAKGDVDLRQFDPKMLAGMMQPEPSSGSGQSEDGNPGNKSLQDIAATLPPAQRELFLRIRQQQQRDQTVNQQDDSQGKKDEEDDNWYSSDEEDTKTSKTKLTDILKTIGQPVNAASQSQPAPPPGQMNIAQMLTAIRNSGPAEAKPDPRTARSDPRSTNKMAALEVRNHSEVSDVDLEVEATGVKLHYSLRLCTVDGRPSVPTHVDLADPKFKDDPRIEKYYKAPKTVSKPTKIQTNVVTSRPAVIDPRASMTVPKPSTIDPRSGLADSRPAGSDPRSGLADSRPAGSDPRARKGYDPRLAKSDSMPIKTSNVRTKLLESLTAGVMGGSSPPTNSRMVKAVSTPAPALLDLPQLTELIPPKVASPPRMPLPELLQEGHKPELPDLLKEWKKPVDQISLRRDSGSGSDSSMGQDNTSSRRRMSLDYRNDPRFKKKKTGPSGPVGILSSGMELAGDSTIAQEDVEMQNENEIDMAAEDRSSLRERGLQHASPLATGGSSNQAGSLSGYNRPPNEKFSQLQEQNKSLGGREPRSGKQKGKHSANKQTPSFQPLAGDAPVTPLFQPEQPLTPILPEQMQAPPLTGLGLMPAPEDVPLKDLFTTIDPTASPFC